MLITIAITMRNHFPRKSQCIINPAFAVVIQVILVGKHIPREGLISLSAHSRVLRIRCTLETGGACVISAKYEFIISEIISPSTQRCAMQRCVPALALLAKEPYPSVDPEDRNVFT